MQRKRSSRRSDSSATRETVSPTGSTSLTCDPSPLNKPFIILLIIYSNNIHTHIPYESCHRMLFIVPFIHLPLATHLWQSFDEETSHPEQVLWAGQRVQSAERSARYVGIASVQLQLCVSVQHSPASHFQTIMFDHFSIM